MPPVKKFLIEFEVDSDVDSDVDLGALSSFLESSVPAPISAFLKELIFPSSSIYSVNSHSYHGSLWFLLRPLYILHNFLPHFILIW